MRVSVIPTITAHPWGAPGHCMGALIDELLTAGHEVQWFVASIDLEHPEVARLAGRGAKVVRLPDAPANYARLRGVRRAWDRLKSGRRSLAEEVASFAPNHLFVNDGGTWSGISDPLFGVLQRMRGRYSIISHLNQPHPPFTEPDLTRARALLAGAARVFFNSAWSLRLAELQTARPIERPGFYQLPLRSYAAHPLPWPETSRPRFAMVTRLDCWHKGLDLALEAFAGLLRQGEEASLTFVGRGPDEGYLRELAGHLGLGEEVFFRPHTDDVAAIWATEEMLLLPSRFEGLGVSMLEAMNCGRPVLRTPYGGCREWIEDGVNGFVCPAAEVDLLVAAIQRALAERPRWREMGVAAHAKIREKLDPRPARVFLEALK